MFLGAPSLRIQESKKLCLQTQSKRTSPRPGLTQDKFKRLSHIHLVFAPLVDHWSLRKVHQSIQGPGTSAGSLGVHRHPDRYHSSRYPDCSCLCPPNEEEPKTGEGSLVLIRSSQLAATKLALVVRGYYSRSPSGQGCPRGLRLQIFLKTVPAPLWNSDQAHRDRHFGCRYSTNELQGL